MGKRFINTYVKYVAKKPILFFAMVCVFVFFILFLSLTTKTSLIQTYDGTMTGNSIVVNTEIKTAPDKIYVYENRNEAVFLVSVTNIDHNDSTTTFFLNDGTELSEISNTGIVKIDIPIGEISLFERIFLKGGKVYG
jgi:hypothetical protein